MNQIKTDKEDVFFRCKSASRVKHGFDCGNLGISAYNRTFLSILFALQPIGITPLMLIPQDTCNEIQVTLMMQGLEL